MLKLLTDSKPWWWLIIPRIIAAAPLLFIGINHFQDLSHIRNILIASQMPLVEVNVVAAPINEVLAGTLLLIGLFGRVGGVLAAMAMLPAIYSTMILGGLTPDALPPGLTEVPDVPPIGLPFAVLFASLFSVFFGAGTISVDAALNKNSSPPTE